MVYKWEKDQLDNEVRSKLLAIGIAQKEVDHLIYLMQNPCIMMGEKRMLEKVISPRN